MTVRGHAIPLAALVTARGHVCGLFPPLTACDQRRVDDEPDVSDRRVWIRWLSPRLLSSLKRLLQLLLLLGVATVAALPSVVQDLARFFLSLAGSSSLGAVGSVAGAAALASGVGA